MWDIFNKFQMFYVCFLGNYDCLGIGEDVYRVIYGDFNFVFIVGNVCFICFNINVMEYDYLELVFDFNFIENELNNLLFEIEKMVFVMYVKFFEFVFNNNVVKIF